MIVLHVLHPRDLFPFQSLGPKEHVYTSCFTVVHSDLDVAFVCDFPSFNSIILR